MSLCVFMCLVPCLYMRGGLGWSIGSARGSANDSVQTHSPTTLLPFCRLAPNVHVVRGDMDEGPAITYPEHKASIFCLMKKIEGLVGGVDSVPLSSLQQTMTASRLRRPTCLTDQPTNTLTHTTPTGGDDRGVPHRALPRPPGRPLGGPAGKCVDSLFIRYDMARLGWDDNDEQRCPAAAAIPAPTPLSNQLKQRERPWRCCSGSWTSTFW